MDFFESYEEAIDACRLVTTTESLNNTCRKLALSCFSNWCLVNYRPKFGLNDTFGNDCLKNEELLHCIKVAESYNTVHQDKCTPRNYYNATFAFSNVCYPDMLNGWVKAEELSEKEMSEVIVNHCQGNVMYIANKYIVKLGNKYYYRHDNKYYVVYMR